jgi:hypothetical protein
MYYRHKLLDLVNGSSMVFKNNHLKYLEKVRKVHVCFCV